MNISKLSLLAVMLLAGCMSGMKYSAADGNIWNLGFSETQLAPEIYRVTFNGYNIAAAKATDFALLRAAELCLQSGFTHFIVTDENGQTTSGPGMMIANGSSAIYASASQPEITLTVLLCDERPGAYAAAFIRDSLKKKYRIK